MTDALSRLQELVEVVTPTVEFYLKREIESPANHQEFAREAQEKLDRWRELEALLRALEQREREIRELSEEMERKAENMRTMGFNEHRGEIVTLESYSRRLDVILSGDRAASA